MGKINLGITGGDGPYTITIREVNELTGNRYTGPNPTNTLSNLDVNFIKDSTNHLYTASVSNGICSAGTEIFEHICPCEFVPSFIASQDCTNPQAPKILVTVSSGNNSFSRITIYSASNVVLHDVTSADGTSSFVVNNNQTYRIAVSGGTQDTINCRAVDQFVNVSCVVTCSLNVSISNPSCA